MYKIKFRQSYNFPDSFLSWCLKLVCERERKGRCARARDHLRASCVSCMQGLLKNNMADLVCSISPFPRLFLCTSFLRRGRNSFRGVRRRRICLHFKLLCFSWRNLLKICRYFVGHIPKDILTSNTPIAVCICGSMRG